MSRHERTLTQYGMLRQHDITYSYYVGCLATSLNSIGQFYKTGGQLTLAKYILRSSSELNKQIYLSKHTLVMPISPETHPDSSPYSSTNILPRYRKHEWGLVPYTLTI